MPATIILFEDIGRLRESLAYLFETYPGYEVLGHYNDCNNAASIVQQYEPEVVLMDIDMPGMNGIAGVAAIKEVRPQTAVIMYTVFEDNERLFDCLCAGANGYLLKKTAPSKLFEAIEDVLNGGSPLSPVIARKVLDSFQQKTQAANYNLSSRETDVLKLLIKGYSIKLIAAELAIAFDTVRSHLKNIYQKLHVNCGKEAIAKAITEKIV